MVHVRVELLHREKEPQKDLISINEVDPVVGKFLSWAGSKLLFVTGAGFHIKSGH